MARKGTFGSKLPPFGGGAFSDLSVYQIGAAPAAAPPPVPTVAPEAGVLPQPVLPRPTLPRVYLNPDTSAASEETGPLSSRKFDRLRQHHFVANEARLLAELLAADG